ncbi:hypothetical protein EV143_104396 [Flavobacterium chryseum]|uniref:hypothetical protein n=1 Tax=Flavobacterium sp. P3160 TaxID=2512113 RepID=UPI00105E32F4|nr:hypothetical protein [Flavobacterium sp. P3160]TDO77629.1 hypothetical protein EV143_104396 [Flavobacterium sp. P3160]
MDALTKKEKKVLGQALRLLFDKSEDFKTSTTVLELAQKFETKNADEMKNDLQFITNNPF